LPRQEVWAIFEAANTLLPTRIDNCHKNGQF